MKIKHKPHKKDPRRQTDRRRQMDRRQLTLMAVQEKLGLFAKQAETQDEQDHDYLKNKPLGLI